MFSTSASPGIRIDQFLPSSFTTRIPHFPSQKKPPQTPGFHLELVHGLGIPILLFLGRRIPTFPSGGDRGRIPGLDPDPSVPPAPANPTQNLTPPGVAGGSGASWGASQFILELSRWESGPKIPLPNLELEISPKS